MSEIETVKLENGSPELDSKRMSVEEYRKEYNLDNPDVFKQQSQQLELLENIMTLETIIMKLMSYEGVNTVQDMKAWTKRAWDESQHFKDYIREMVKNDSKPF